jgi:myo-inositol catabolism protein IolC
MCCHAACCAVLCHAVLRSGAGARSTAGREGPVVGRPVRQSGSRPLLLNEILEHWVDEIKPTCLLRWSRQAGCSCSQLEQQVMEAYMQVRQL